MTNQPEDEKTLDDLGDDRTVHDSGGENPATLNDDQRAGETSGGPDRTVEQQPGAATCPDEQKTIDEHPEKDNSEDADWLDKQQSLEISDPKESADQAPNRQDRTVESTVPASKPAATATEKQTRDAAPGITAPAGRLRSPETSLPEHIAGYETLSRLGEGSFGVVLKCRDIKLNRPVAIKLQKVNPLKSQGRVDRFLGEARAAGRLRHPHIVPVYEFGEFGGNQFIVYEFVDGQTMDEWVSANHDTRKQVEMVARIADALDYAHSLGIVHRDIKPANLLIDHEHQQPHIADFGCAKHENPDGMQTVDGSLMGTPAYMSPEVCDGLANQADGRADLWALGIILYEMLVGQRPFKGKYAELFRQIRSREPKRPRQIDPAIPEDLETITLKCIEKDKDRRFETCGQLADDLRNWLEGRPITARKVGTWERTWLWSKRNPAVATLLGLVASFLVLITVLSIVFSISTRIQNAKIIDGRINSLATADATMLPTIIDDIVDLDPKSIEDVKDRLDLVDQDPLASFPFNLTLYRMARETGSLDEVALRRLVEYVPLGRPDRHRVLLEIVSKDDLEIHNDDFWNIAQDATRTSDQRLLAASILATTDPNNANWIELVDPLIGHLLDERSARIPDWTGFLKVSPEVAELFKEPLEKLFFNPDSLDADNRKNERDRAAEIISWMHDCDEPFIARLSLSAEPRQMRWFRRVFEQDPSSKEGKEVAAAIDAVGQLESLDEKQLPNLYLMQGLAGKHSPLEEAFEGRLDSVHPDIRHRLISICGPAGLDAGIFKDWIAREISDELNEEESLKLAAAILALGQYDLILLYENERVELKSRLLDLFKHHRHVAVHSACRWLLNKWEFKEDVERCLADIQTPDPKPGYSWHEDPIGVCFAVFEPVELYQFGQGDSSKVASIDRRFGIATHEFTRQQLADLEDQRIQEFRSQADGNQSETADRLENAKKSRLKLEQNDPATKQAPVTNVTWEEIAYYCNEMNRIAGIGASNDVYETYLNNNKKGFVKDALTHAGALKKTGYRMPTGQEWEYACRGKTNSKFFYGNAIDLFEDYGWSVNNSHNRRQPVGLKKPGDTGLFDIHGNVSELCHNMLDPEAVEPDTLPREYRGQSVLDDPTGISSFKQQSIESTTPASRVGFRLARTYLPPDSE